ncbi:MAG: hypothetical protein QGG42_02565 [Phycisphaerae bacterium]|jgi:hypothetical protein|nr:hypothetical protein [Phycisphaerae bacterium]
MAVVAELTRIIDGAIKKIESQGEDYLTKALERIVAEQSEGQQEDAVLGVKSKPAFKSLCLHVRQVNELIVEARERYAPWKTHVDNLRKLADAKRLAEGIRGRPPVLDTEKELAAYESNLVAEIEQVQREIEGLPGLLDLLFQSFNKLREREPIVESGRKLIPKIEKAADQLEELVDQLMTASDEYGNLLKSVEHFQVSEWELVDLNAMDVWAIRGFVRTLKANLDREKTRLADCDLHAKGELSDRERESVRQNERRRYQNLLQEAAAAFRKTPIGKTAWRTVRQQQMNGAEALSKLNPTETKYQQIRQAMDISKAAFWTNVANFANLEVHKEDFPTN